MGLDKSIIMLRQNLSLEDKERLTKRRIIQYLEKHNGKAYTSFSGGLDSTVLLHICRSVYPEIGGVFCDTGLEYPEIRDFVKTSENVETIRPKMGFREVIATYGFPVISKEQAKYIREVQRGTTKYTEEKRRFGKNGTKSGMVSKKWQKLFDAPFKVSEKCCDIMKKRPFHLYQKQTKCVPIVGTTAQESSLRLQSYIRYGCEITKEGREQLRPLMFWRKEDIWGYVKKYNVPYCELYDLGENKTGCMFCMFGAHLEKQPNRFQRMQLSHPKIWKFCIYELGLKEPLEFCGIPYIASKQLSLF